MERRSKILVYCLIILVVQSCCWFKKCDECFEDANLWFPDQVTNVEIARSYGPTYVSGVYYPSGTIVGVTNNVYTFNEFFSVKRYMPEVGQQVTFFWNRNTPPNFTSLEEGEMITYYKTVVNQRVDNSLECVFQEVEEVKSILDVKVRTVNGEIEGTRTVEKTIFNIPSGKYGTFNFEFEFFACGNYEFDITLDPEGQLNETSIIDNNYLEVIPNFGSCD